MQIQASHIGLITVLVFSVAILVGCVGTQQPQPPEEPQPEPVGVKAEPDTVALSPRGAQLS